MPINYIPNDPLAAGSPPSRQIAPRPNRPSGRAGFTFSGQVSEGLFNPGTPGFLFWQCREAALAAVEVWEDLNGNLMKWAPAVPNPKKLSLIPNDGVDLNAFYDRISLSFFESTAGAKTTFSGASTDVVAHEAGHAFLDSIRPDLWDSNFTESNAFHEAFGDCVAILTALFDKETRKALLAATADLSKPNFVEATAEDLSDGVRLQIGPNHAAALPRRALNDFKWQIPATLPSSGGPAVLSSEVHSLGRIFSGCFYDVIRNIFNALPTRNEAALLTAARTAGKLLIEGAKNAPDTPRFFQAVGRAMALADQAQNGGANNAHIGAAFGRHSISLGSSAMLAPRAVLAGSGPKRKGAILSAATRGDIKSRIGADSKSRLAVSMTAFDLDGEPVAEAMHRREISLTGVLEGVVCGASEPTLVSNVAGRAAIVSAIPDSYATADEVHDYVKGLLTNKQISLDTVKTKAKKGVLGAAPAKAKASATAVTHAIKSRGGKKVLERVKFSCGCHRL